MLSIIGTIYLDKGRLAMFRQCLESLAPVVDMIDTWRYNMAGPEREAGRSLVQGLWPRSDVTIDDNKASTYDLVTGQLAGLRADAPVFLLQEDHWFVCPWPPLFRMLVQEFVQGPASALIVSHVLSSRNVKARHLPVAIEHPLYKALQVNAETYGRVWQAHPRRNLTGIPAIYKRPFFEAIIEHKRDILAKSRVPADLEMGADSGQAFLAKGMEYLDMISAFHAFREVDMPQNRAMSSNDARLWIALRDHGPKLGSSWEDVHDDD